MKLLILLTTINYLQLVSASEGDTSFHFRKCLERCLQLDCTDKYHFKNVSKYNWNLQLLQWSCEDNCKYECMWYTVGFYKSRKWRVPQFYGKWPFIRILGVQEPASVVFSIMNLAIHYIHVKHLNTYRKSSTFIWKMYAWANIHAWFWSAVFHARDTPFTEKMDYICAFSVIACGLHTMAMRLMLHKRVRLKLVFSVMIIAVFINHALYLSKGSFDYAYNIFFNVLIGALACSFWILWGFTYIRTQPYVWKIVLFSTLMPLALTLEILDFPPFFWIVDAHSLWHLTTVPLNMLFYSFVHDDVKYVQQERNNILKIGTRNEEKYL